LNRPIDDSAVRVTGKRRQRRMRVSVMALSHKQAHKVEEWLNSRGNRNCPMCGSGEWETGEIVSSTSVDNSGNVLPIAQSVSGNGRYVMLIAAMLTGLV
jgi:hypothetical protein